LSYKSVTQVLYHNTRVFLSNSIKHVTYCGVLIHKSNTPFPVTRHWYTMMCDRVTLQPLFENLI